MTIVHWGAQQTVSTSAASGQTDPCTVALQDGGFVVVWDDNRYTGIDADFDVIRGQRYGADGSPSGGEFVISTTNAGQQRNPVATALSGGGFAVAWEDTSASGADTQGSSVRARVYDQSGDPVSADFVVNTTVTADQTEPSIAPLGSGGFVVTWTDGSGTGGDTSGTQIRAQLFSDVGAKDGGEFRVNTTVADDQWQSASAGLATGGFAVTWNDLVNEQLFTGDGAMTGPEHTVDPSTAYIRGASQIAGLSDGGFVVTWAVAYGATGGGGGVIDFYPKARFQLFDQNGALIGPIETAWDAAAVSPAGTGLRDDSFLIAWGDNSANLEVLQFSALGQRITDMPIQLNSVTEGTLADVHMSVLSDGRVVAAFENAGQISFQVLDTRDGDVEGTDNAETLYGNDGYDDVILGLAGSDTLYGLAGNDTLDGGDGDDTLLGGLGNDTYVLGEGGDAVSDAGGIDTVETLITRSLSGLPAIENLTLLGAGAINGYGNGFNNRIIGNDSANYLYGSTGDDLLSAGLGNDSLVGGIGSDILYGGAGLDILTGGMGRDVMTGGADRDVFDFNAVSETGKTAATRDVIKDFQHLVDDIDLSTIDANGSAAGNAAFKFLSVHAAAFTGVSGQLRWFRIDAANNALDKTIIEGDVNGDRVADFQIELTGLKTLTAADFIL